MLGQWLNPRSLTNCCRPRRAWRYCLFFGTPGELQILLGVGHAVPSKLALFTNLKPHGSAKHRPIWDLLRSDDNSTASLPEPIVSLRLEDSVEDGKHLLWVHGAVEWLVVDGALAFHNIPIRPSERQFTCGKVWVESPHPKAWADVQPALDAWFHRQQRRVSLRDLR